jgi:hypothetical protein
MKERDTGKEEGDKVWRHERNNFSFSSSGYFHLFFHSNSFKSKGAVGAFIEMINGKESFFLSSMPNSGSIEHAKVIGFLHIFEKPGLVHGVWLLWPIFSQFLSPT